MLLDEKELTMLNKLGFKLKNDRIVQMPEKTASNNLNYAGFNIYISTNNHVFEKIGEELVEIDSEELEAERRFIERNL